MKSPFAPCDAIKKAERRTLKYRGEEYSYLYQYYQCEQTGLTFTTEYTDNVSILQVYNQYRSAHNIPYASEIRQMRKAYGISAAKMSLILGWGENQYRLYENGDMPSLNNGKQLRAIQKPSVFITYVEESSLEEKEKEQIKERALHSPYAEDAATAFVRRMIFGHTSGAYQGYTSPSLSKLKNVMLYFISKMGRVFQTKMNKLLFYADFLFYREYAHGITGLSYVAHHFGPVPEHWDKVFSLTDDINKEVILCQGGYEGYVLTSEMSYDEASFTPQEIDILQRVADHFAPYSPRQISEESHKEDAWKDHIEGHKLIPYSYAFRLKAV